MTWHQALAGNPSPAPGRLRLSPPDQACYTSLNLSFLNCKTEDCEDSPGYIDKALRTDPAWLRRPIKPRGGGPHLQSPALGLSFSIWKMGGKGCGLQGLPPLSLPRVGPHWSLIFVEGKVLRGDVPHLGGSQARMGKPMSIACQASWSCRDNSYSPTSTISPGQRGSLPQSSDKRLRGLHTHTHTHTHTQRQCLSICLYFSLFEGNRGSF